MVDRIDILRVERFEREDPAAPLVVERKVALPQHRILEIGIGNGDIALHGFIRCWPVLLYISSKAQLMTIVISDTVNLADILGNTSKQTAVVTRLIRNPDIGRRTREETRTAAQLQRTVFERFPVEAHARRELRMHARIFRDVDLDAIPIGVGCDRGILLQVGQENRHVDTQTVGQREAVAGRPLVLHIEAELQYVDFGEGETAVGSKRIALLELRLPRTCTVGKTAVDGIEAPLRRIIRANIESVHIAVRSHVILRGQHVELEVVDRREDPRARIVLREAVLERTIVRLRADGDLVTAVVHREVVLNLEDVGIELIVVGVGLGTEDRIARSVFEDVDLREETAVHVAIVAQTRVSHLQRVGHVVVDRRVPVGHDDVEIVVRAVVARREGHGIGVGAASVGRSARRRRCVRIIGFQVVVLQREGIPIVDIPVDTRRKTIGPRLGLRQIVTARIVVELIAEKFGQIVQIGSRDTRIGQTVRDRFVLTVQLAVDEEEELVLHDRAAQAHTVLTIGELRHLTDIVAHAVALQLGTLGIHIGRSVPLVGTRLGHRVDTAAREAAVAHVVGSDHHLHLLDRFERDGLRTLGAQRRRQAERVVERRTVDGHVVETIRRTGEILTARHGRQFDEFIERTARRRQFLHHFERHDLLRARAVGIEDRIGLAYDHHFADRLRVFAQHEVQRSLLADGQIDSLDLFRIAADKADLHIVRTSHTHTAQVELAVACRCRSILRTRRRMHGDDRRTDDRLAVGVGDATAHARRRHLCRSRTECEQRQK